MVISPEYLVILSHVRLCGCILGVLVIPAAGAQAQTTFKDDWFDAQEAAAQFVPNDNAYAGKEYPEHFHKRDSFWLPRDQSDWFLLSGFDTRPIERVVIHHIDRSIWKATHIAVADEDDRQRLVKAFRSPRSFRPAVSDVFPSFGGVGSWQLIAVELTLGDDLAVDALRPDGETVVLGIQMSGFVLGRVNGNIRQTFFNPDLADVVLEIFESNAGIELGDRFRDGLSGKEYYFKRNDDPGRTDPAGSWHDIVDDYVNECDPRIVERVKTMFRHDKSHIQVFSEADGKRQLTTDIYYLTGEVHIVQHAEGGWNLITKGSIGFEWQTGSNQGIIIDVTDEDLINYLLYQTDRASLMTAMYLDFLEVPDEFLVPKAANGVTELRPKDPTDPFQAIFVDRTSFWLNGFEITDRETGDSVKVIYSRPEAIEAMPAAIFDRMEGIEFLKSDKTLLRHISFL